MANAAFTDKLSVTSCGTYDCNQHVSSKAQVKQRVLVSFACITQEETIAALASLHNRANPTVPFTGVSSIALLPDIPIFEGKSDTPSHRRDLRTEVGLTGREAKFLALTMDGLAPADDQGMRFSVKFQPPLPVDVTQWAPCIAHAVTTQLAPYFGAAPPTVESVLPISPFGNRLLGHLPSSILVTLSAPPDTGIIALPQRLRVPNGQIVHPDHGFGLRPIYATISVNWFLNGAAGEKGLFYLTDAVKHAPQNGHARQLAAIRNIDAPPNTRASRQLERHKIAVQVNPPGTDVAALGYRPRRRRAPERRNSRSRSRSPPQDPNQRRRIQAPDGSPVRPHDGHPPPPDSRQLPQAPAEPAPQQPSRDNLPTRPPAASAGPRPRSAQAALQPLPPPPQPPSVVVPPVAQPARQPPPPANPSSSPVDPPADKADPPAGSELNDNDLKELENLDLRPDASPMQE